MTITEIDHINNAKLKKLARIITHDRANARAFEEVVMALIQRLAEKSARYELGIEDTQNQLRELLGSDPQAQADYDALVEPWLGPETGDGDGSFRKWKEDTPAWIYNLLAEYESPVKGETREITDVLRPDQAM